MRDLVNDYAALRIVDGVENTIIAGAEPVLVRTSYELDGLIRPGVDPQTVEARTEAADFFLWKLREVPLGAREQENVIGVPASGAAV